MVAVAWRGAHQDRTVAATTSGRLAMSAVLASRRPARKSATKAKLSVGERRERRTGVPLGGSELPQPLGALRRSEQGVARVDRIVHRGGDLRRLLELLPRPFRRVEPQRDVGPGRQGAQPPEPVPAGGLHRRLVVPQGRLHVVLLPRDVSQADVPVHDTQPQTVAWLLLHQPAERRAGLGVRAPSERVVPGRLQP